MRSSCQFGLNVVTSSIALVGRTLPLGSGAFATGPEVGGCQGERLRHGHQRCGGLPCRCPAFWRASSVGALTCMCTCFHVESRPATRMNCIVSECALNLYELFMHRCPDCTVRTWPSCPHPEEACCESKPRAKAPETVRADPRRNVGARVVACHRDQAGPLDVECRDLGLGAMEAAGTRPQRESGDQFRFMFAFV